jgi:hypothetical protein
MLDPSIPLGVKNTELPDPLELQRAYREAQTAKKQGRMSDLLLAGAERDNTKALEADKKAQTIKGLLQVNTEMGPNGAPTLNKGRLIGDLGRLGYTQEAMDFQKQDQADQLAAAKAKRQEFTEKLGLMGQILGGHNAQNYPTKYAALKALGFDESDGIPDPSKYDPDMIEGALKQGLTYKERLEQTDKEETRKDSRAKQTAQEKKDADAAALALRNADEAKRHNIATEGIQRIAAGNKPPDTNLPLDVKEQIKGLSSKNASKIAIKNQIDNSLAQLKLAKDDDTKVRIGRGMLKILNSTEGADAIGAEESKRLGDALEYNIFDVSAGLGMKPGKLHGRDLAGFLTQAQAVSDAIGGSVKANQAEVDRLYGRKAAAAPTLPAAPISSLKPNQDGSFDYVPGGH